MKHTVLLLLATLTIPFWSATTSAQNTEAEEVMNQYFAALVSGDAARLKSLMGGALLRKRYGLLNNPTYPSYLAKTYVNASFTIIGCNNTGSGSVEVDAMIDFGQNEVIEKRYVLEKLGSPASYHLVSEHAKAE